MTNSQLQAPKYDLTYSLLPYLDRHLALPLIDHLDERHAYPHNELLEAKLQLLQSTNMVNYIATVDKELHGPDGSQQTQADCKKRESAILSTLEDLESKAKAVMDIITNPQVFQALKQDKQQNLEFLKSQHGLPVQDIDTLYKLGRYQYTVGQYPAASDYLYHFRVLTVDADLESSAMWGKLVSDTLEGSWDAALSELDLIRKTIDNSYPVTPSSSSTAPTIGLQQRTWFLHWSLFVYFNHEQGREKLVEAWMSQSSLPATTGRDGRDQQNYLTAYLPALQANAPHLLRYLIAAVILSRSAVFKGNAYLGSLARISTREQMGTAILLTIKQEPSIASSDPLVGFVKALFVDLDFPAASKFLSESRTLVQEDFFLNQFEDEWMERARWAYSEAYCRVHHQIDIVSLSEQLGLSAEEGERWIVNLIRDARLDAKIDLKENIVQMNRYDTTAHQTVIDKTKSILERSTRLDYSADAGQQQGGNRNRGGPARGGRDNRQQQQQKEAADKEQVDKAAPSVEVA